MQKFLPTSSWGRRAAARQFRAVASLFKVVLAILLLTAAGQRARAAGALENGGVLYVVDEAARTAVVSVENATKFSGISLDLVIPAVVTDDKSTDRYEGEFTVVGMEKRCFAYTGITGITINANIKEIPDSAFYYCQSLLNVKLPDTLERIGQRAFYYTQQLGSIVLPESMTLVDEYAFYGSGLKELVLNKALQTVKRYGFYYCPQTTSVTIPEGSRTVFEEYSMNFSSLKSLTIPAGITAKANSFCYLGYLTELYLPDEPFEVEPGAFTNLYALEKLTIPGWMKVVKSYFQTTTHLLEITFEEGVEVLDQNAIYSYLLETAHFPSTLRVIRKEGMQGGAVNFEFPERMDTIAENGFNVRCDVLKLPKGVHIGSYALKGTFKYVEWPDVQTEADVPTFDETPFGWEPSVVEITIPGWMEKVPDKLLYNAGNLTKLTIENGVGEIGEYAFHGGQIETLTIPGSVKHINSFAFSSLPYLKELNFSPGLISIGKQAFEQYGYDTPLQRIVLPETLVTIGEAAFMGYNYLSYLYIPASVREIGDRAFMHGAPLDGVLPEMEIVFEEGVESIGAEAFQSWGNLKNFKLPSSLRHIGRQAFFSAGPLDIVDLSKVTSIDDNAFNKAFGQAVIFPESPDAVYGENIFKDFHKQNLEGVTDHNQIYFQVTLPDGMTAIPDNMFNGFTYLNKVEIPQGGEITKIGSKAFAHTCMRSFGDDELAWPKSVKEINDFAYAGDTIFVFISPDVRLSDHALEESVIRVLSFSDDVCDHEDYTLPSFKNATLPFNKFSIDEDGNIEFEGMMYRFEIPECIKKIPANCFEGIKGTYGFIFNAGLEEIGDEAFLNANIQHVYFKRATSLKKVGARAFRGTNVEIISWGDHPFELGEGAFQQADLAQVKIPAWMEEIPNGCFAEQGGKNNFLTINNLQNRYSLSSGHHYSRVLEHIVFEERTKPLKIGDYAFWGNIALTGGLKGWQSTNTLELPDCDITIGYRAFNMNAFSAIQWPGSTHTVVLKDEAFRHSTSLTSLVLPKNVILDGENIFRAATNMTILSITAPYTSIPAGTFQNCEKLYNIALNSELEVIEDRAFMYTKALNTLTLPSNLKKIGNNAFTASNLYSLTLPEDVEEIGDYAFAATNIKTATKYVPYGLHFNDGLKRIGTGAFEKDYSNSTNWSLGNTGEFREKNAVDTIYGLGIGIYTYRYTTLDKKSSPTFTDLTIPKSVEYIGMDAFRGLSSLSALTITGDSIKTIGSSAFHSTGITSIDLDFGDNIVNIGNSVFGSCTKLLTGRISGGHIREFSHTFAGCSSLTDADITSNSGVALLSSTFSGNSSLINVTVTADSIDIGESAFQNCTSLVRPVLNSKKLDIGKYAFRYDTSLKGFNVPDGAQIHGVGTNAFQNCTSLETVPWLRDVKHVNYSAFSGCSALKAVEYPLVGMVNTLVHERNVDNVCGARDIGQWESGFFSSCTSLQSVTFHSVGDVFKLDYLDFYNAPLKGVSYFEGKAPRVRPDSNYWDGYYPVEDGTLGWYKFDQYNSYDNERGYKPLLYVERGQAWKFCEAGYGKFFDIRERKNPRINLRGDIFSEFDIDRNVNSYTAVLSWDVQLSDLDMTAPTHFTIYRNNNENGDVLVADATFSKPEKVKVTTFEGTDEAYKVSVEITKGTARPTDEQLAQGVLFSGYIDYVDEDDASGLTYKSMNVTQNRDLYFDASTFRRLDSFDRYSDYSPFIFVERFESPELNSGEPIPSCYTYTATLDGYEYTECVNNENFAEGDSGFCYEEKPMTFGGASSGDVQIYPAAVMPSIDFPGLYTREEVMADHDASLAVSVNPTTADGLSIDYEIAGDLALQKGNDTFNHVEDYIVREIEVYSTDSKGKRLLLGTITPNGESAGSIQLDTEAKLAPGTRYQFVTNTMFRGKFGSPVMTIPGVPWMGIARSRTTADLSGNGETDHDSHSTMAYSDIRVRYHVADMGYDESKFDPSDLQTSFPGYWRGFRSGVSTFRTSRTSSSEYDNNTLVYHHDTRHESAPDCDACQGMEGYETSHPYLRMFDVYDVEQAGDFEGVYTVRHYVKVPDHMLHNSNQWMVAELPVSFGSNIAISGVENVAVDEDSATGEAGAEVRWFSIDGVEVAHPEEGRLYIRVEGKSVTKVLYHQQ